MYKVIKYFTDLQDNNHAYNVGDEFPHKGLEVSEKRLLELSTDANRRRIPLIEKVEEVETVEEVEEVKEPVEGFMNPPEEKEETAEEVEESEDEKEDAPKAKKKRGRPRNDAE